VDVRVNIVGFAIDDQELRASFRYWADLGGGGYFDANNPAALGESVSQALRQPFEVVNAKGQVVAEGLIGGDPVDVMPGAYTVRTKSKPVRSQSVEVRPQETATVRLAGSS
ncbi:MAG: hypothetical protein GY953_20835, partial [bacterium]|nr:hypothetical protein [bacterium]